MDPISNSVEVLKDNLGKIARVSEWADMMGYDCPKKFARKFLRHYYKRPQTTLKNLRLKCILNDLRENRMSNFEIARKYGIPDEIALNKFINYHLDCSPTDIKKMPDQEFSVTLEKFGSKVR